MVRWVLDNAAFKRDPIAVPLPVLVFLCEVKKFGFGDLFWMVF